MDIKVGVTFEMVMPKFPGYKTTYTITDVKAGNIQLDTIAVVAPNTQDKAYEIGEMSMEVEQAWFGENTGRKFTIL